MPVEQKPTSGTHQTPSDGFPERELLRVYDLLTGLTWFDYRFEQAVEPVAALLLARWLAFEEEERRAIALFEDFAFEPRLPSELQEAAWSPLAGRQLIEALARSAGTGTGSLGSPIWRISRLVAPAVTRRLPEERAVLEHLAGWVAGLQFQDAAVRQGLEQLLDHLLIESTKAHREVGEHVTPGGVRDLMLALADPQAGDRIYDPCFGVGGLLVGAARRILAASRTLPAEKWSQIGSDAIYGVELNQSAYLVGLTRVLLAGVERPGLELGDALERPLPRNRAVEGFDCILASPPWGGRASPNRSRQYPIPTGGVENLFLQHIMASLRPGGRAVVVLPEGTLFRTGADRQVRRLLLSDFRVDGVVSLPEGAFAPCTGVASSLLVFRRAKPRESIRFLRARLPGMPIAEGRGPDTPKKTAEALTADLSRLGPEWADPTGFVAPPVETWAWDVPIGALAQRDYELIAKRSGLEDLEAGLDELRRADPELNVAPLDAIADVFAGVSYDRNSTTDKGDGQMRLGLVRVGDVTEARIKRPSLTLNAQSPLQFSSNQFLRSGDILLTTSGSVGKVGLVEDLMMDMHATVAAKSLAVIRVGNQAVPAYVAGLLRSPKYQTWIAGHARGATIQHLSTRTLRKLPIPLPPLPIQDAVVRNLGKGGADVVPLLSRYLSGGTSDPIATWLEGPVVADLLSERGASGEPATALSRMGSAILELRAFRNQEVHGSGLGVGAETLAWLVETVDAGAVLAGIDKVPEGTARLAALELAKARTERSRRALDASDAPQAVRLRAVSGALIRLIEATAALMMRSVSLTGRVEPTELVVGVPTELQLHLRNDSGVGLRSVRITTRPDVGSGELAYLAEAASATVALTIQAKSTEESLPIAVKWEATRIDGVLVSGDLTVELLVLSGREAARLGDLGPSPYIVGNPVDREEMFFGRQDVVETIRRQLGSSGNSNVILLEGNRRTGKTSILRQLQKKDVLPGWVAVYCSFQDAEGDDTRRGVSTTSIYRLLARSIGWGLFENGIRAWFAAEPAPRIERPFKIEFRAALDRAFESGSPFEVFKEYLAGALEAARPSRVLLMLDEFDKLQEGIDSGTTSPQVPENIRHLLQHQAGFSAILAGSMRLKRLRQEYWSALFGLGYRISISALSEEAARKLVVEPVAGRLNYLLQARDRIVELCARQPFLIQSLCSRVFDRAAASDERTVTIEAVNEAAAEMVPGNEHFRTLWEYAKTNRRRLLLALCERLAQGPDAVNIDLLAARLEEFGVPVSRRSHLGDDLEWLRELELLDLDKSYRGGTYRISVPLLGTWIRESIDFDDVLTRAREEAQEAQ